MIASAQHRENSRFYLEVPKDINQHHFEGSESDRAAVGSFLRLPFEDESLDYVNMGFALHYTKFLPSRRQYERLEALHEMSRVLKEGGRAVITIVHNFDFKNKDEFKNVCLLARFPCR